MQHVRGYVNSHGTWTHSYVRRSPAASSGGGGSVVAGIGGLALVFFLLYLFSTDSGASQPRPNDWSNAGLGYSIRQSSGLSMCAELSYGDVQDWLRQHTCTGLHRSLYDVTDQQDRHMAVSVAKVEMPDHASAVELQGLVDDPGTGNITELGATKYTGLHYDSEVTGSTVTIAQAEPDAADTVPSAQLQQAATSGLLAPQ